MRALRLPHPVLEVGQDELPRAYDWLRASLKRAPAIQRGRVHAQDVSTRPEFAVRELHNVVMTYDAPATIEAAQTFSGANLPWAEDHFLERVSGVPHNPAPSEQWWPFRKNNNKQHKHNNGTFSHTYPERFWPKFANEGNIRPNGRQVFVPHNGVRYEFGDLDDVVALLRRDPFTRQAFLPIWFPEDTGSVANQRVPCSLGYHFIRRGTALDCQYFMRSCDFFRHFPDDVYMAIRLMQWMVAQIVDHSGYPYVGKLTMFISNLHCFRGDDPRL